MISRYLAFCAAVLLTGCPSSKVDGTNVSAARAFYSQPVTQQMRTFRQHPLADQLNLYFFGNQVREPPAIYLARCFALSGKPAVDLLRSKLEVPNDDLTVRDISALLAAIDSMGEYDVSKDAQLMDALKAQVASMHDERWRETAEKKITSIEHSQITSARGAPECGESQSTKTVAQ